jgi:NADPH:quinone reductase-like Zn-dependent oxidoreductase
MSMVTQYQAIQKGGPFALASVARVTPEANEVSIRLKTIALNPLDWKQLYFGHIVKSWPAVFGIDGAGIVDSVGKEVTKFKPGDEVFSLFGFGPKAGCFQEIATVPEHYVALKPPNISFEDAASLP